MLTLFRQIHGYGAVEGLDLAGIDFMEPVKYMDKPFFRYMFRAQRKGHTVQELFRQVAVRSDDGVFPGQFNVRLVSQHLKKGV